MQSETRFYFLIARIDLMRLNVLKGNKHSNKNSFWRLLGFFFSFLLSLTGAAQCFNSQEKQLKAGRGLTYTQWSKIDERHPAWTNHSTQGEASQQTWKVQEAMTVQMVWKMLLMNDEKKRLWPPLPFTLFVLYYLPCIRQPSHRSLMFYISANHGYVTCIGADPPVRRWRVSAGDGCHSFD